MHAFEIKSFVLPILPRNYPLPREGTLLIKGSVMVIQIFLFFWQAKFSLRHPGTNPG